MIKTASRLIPNQIIFYCLTLLFAVGSFKATAQIFTTGVAQEDKICGKWISEEKNVIVQVYKAGKEYNAKLVWFDDADDHSKPMNSRVDYKNPDVKLRNRKLIGMEVVDNLTYNPATNSWENGIIYDAKSGHNWSSAAYINDEGLLKVTGYWHFKFLGKTMTFKRL